MTLSSRSLVFMSYCFCVITCFCFFFFFFLVYDLYVFFFFFQAEDGIRDLIVTGVQTCALPISPDVAPEELDRLVDMDGMGTYSRHRNHRSFCLHAVSAYAVSIEHGSDLYARG